MKLEEVVVEVKKALEEGKSVRVISTVGDMKDFEVEEEETL